MLEIVADKAENLAICVFDSLNYPHVVDLQRGGRKAITLFYGYAKSHRVNLLHLKGILLQSSTKLKTGTTQ